MITPSSVVPPSANLPLLVTNAFVQIVIRATQQHRRANAPCAAPPGRRPARQVAVHDGADRAGDEVRSPANPDRLRRDRHPDSVSADAGVLLQRAFDQERLADDTPPGRIEAESRRQRVHGRTERRVKGVAGRAGSEGDTARGAADRDRGRHRRRLHGHVAKCSRRECKDGEGNRRIGRRGVRGHDPERNTKRQRQRRKDRGHASTACKPRPRREAPNEPVCE